MPSICCPHACFAARAGRTYRHTATNPINIRADRIFRCRTFQRVPLRLADQPLALGERRDQRRVFVDAPASSRRTVSAFCMPATAPCSAALAYSTMP